MSEKIHPPSARKLAQARADGNVWRATLLMQGIGIVTFMWIAANFKTMVLEALYNLIDLQQHGLTAVSDALRLGAIIGFGFVVIILASVAVVCSVLTPACGGLSFSLKPISLQGNRINPVEGALRIAGGLRDGWQLLVRIALAVAIMGVVWASVLPHLDPILVLSRTAWALGGGLLGIGVFDAVMRQKRFLVDLKMTEEEMRRENRDAEGDPLTRAMQRSLRESLSRDEMIKRLRRSKVLVVRRAGKTDR